MSIKIIWGVPGAGKTFYGVRKAIFHLRRIKKGKGKIKRVFSNFPIYHKKYGWSYVWTPDLALQVVTDSFILIDEAYRDYNSRNSTNKAKKGQSTKNVFTEQEHTFFATCRHLGNDLWLIAHNPARIDVAIREITEEFILMHCHKIPILSLFFEILDFPIYFSADVFLDEQALAQRYNARNAVYCVERFWFHRDIAKSYDTHFFRDKDTEEPEFIRWDEHLNQLKQQQEDFNKHIDDVNKKYNVEVVDLL
jgi:hypothetical protein